MREIKFRAWHTVQKKMYPCEEMVEDQLALLTDGRFINVDGRNTRFSEIDDDGIMIPLQYTGLKDSNDVEICVGDTLQTWCGYVKQDNPVVVEDIGWIFTKLAESDPYYKITRCKVIGNIYENPELMEKGS